MTSKSYRNISSATTGIVQELLENGNEVTIRGQVTRELLSRQTRIERPLERYLFVPGRNNNIVAQFAETLWVLGARNDVAWLERYLPRAPEFSDDGLTWRGAYGPRLRRWAAVDQIEQVRQLLLSDRSSRQAVMSLFDPGQDFVRSKDIPCTNWLGWIIREDRLRMNVVLRSNDVCWGFSGVNSFEWSVLHEMLAHWVEAEVGDANYLAMSLHLYEWHSDRAARVVDAAHGLSPYDFGVGRAVFSTPWEEFGTRLARWFELEREIAARPDVPIGSLGNVGDPLLDSALTLVHFRWAERIWEAPRLAHELSRLPAHDYVAALYQQLGRRHPELLGAIPQQPIADFFRAIAAADGDRSADLKAAIKRLHAEKDRAYGQAWKRRGELVSIQPNIARKVDRLEALLATGAEIKGESALDTAIDLLVYVHKYRLFLAEHMEPGMLLGAGAPIPLSDHEENLDALVDQLDLAPGARADEAIVRDIIDQFERCWRAADTGAPVGERLRTADLVAASAGELVAFLADRDKLALNAFLACSGAA